MTLDDLWQFLHRFHESNHDNSFCSCSGLSAIHKIQVTNLSSLSRETDAMTKI